jgi:hypothetical protein
MSMNSPSEDVNFEDVVGIEFDQVGLQHTITSVIKGKSYAFRYRAKNEYGWSENWSPIVYDLAVDAPIAPPAPTLNYASDA